MSYSHLTQEQRSQILGVHPSAICRELKRNTGLRGYRYRQAHRLAVERRSKASSVPKNMTGDMVNFIENKLTAEQWSPEQISGVLKANN
jgi:IS30 family transposase